MSNKKEIVGLVPVKGSSERVKGKNIRSFGDTSLLELKLKQLKEAKGFSNIIVSSESTVVLELAKESGFSVHNRDPKYSTSLIPMSEVYSYVASEISGENIAWINVTNPLAGSAIYSNAVGQFNSMSDEHDCLLSVSEVQDYFFYKNKPLNFDPYPWARSQDLDPILSMNFVINILKREDMISWGSCVGDNPYFHVVDQLTAWDIDVQADFDFCEFIYTQKMKSR